MILMSMTRQELRKQQERDATRAIRRQAAIAVATELFAQHGFHATAMSDVANTAGLSLKALYDGFPSKEALFEAVLHDVGDRFSELLDTSTSVDDPTRRLLNIVERLVELLAANTAALRMYSRGADGIPAALRDKGSNPFAGFLNRLAGLLADVIRDIQQSGAAQSIDAAVLARGILTVTIAETRHRVETNQPAAGAANDLTPMVSALVAPGFQTGR
jgi:AcrR family transcriptional regulator